MFGYNLKHPEVVSFMLDEMIEGKNLVGRPRQSYGT